jgi:uncharacterized repeat protein (TIGR03843 family)
VRPAERPPRPEDLTGSSSLLAAGEISVKGRLPWSSNGTFLVELCAGEERAPAVYKPLAGERPLWDYPPGLYRREIAAYEVSEALGWQLVPETVERVGPFGVGSVQRFVEADFDEHYFTLLERPEHHDALKAVCAFDLLINNGDRKAGHCLLGTTGRIWGIDHGLCLHAHPKLRTVIWDFEGQPIPGDRIEDVARLALDPPGRLRELIGADEVEALVARAAAVLKNPVFPPARSARAFPWPLI